MQKIAEFYAISAAAKRANPGMKGKLEIVKIGGPLMPRELLTAFYVEGKHHARRLALGYDATPWNF
jgi:hypothetical protein